MSRAAWLTAGFACLALTVSNSMTLSGLSVYDVVFVDEFGWSMGEIKLRDFITLALTGLLAPVAGIFIDRHGVRRCMMVGWLVLMLGYFAYSRMATLPQMYGVHALFALVLVLCGLNATVILVSNWFQRYRGTAIGITLVGSSLGGVLFPQYGTAMIEAYGWRSGFLVAMAFPALLFLLTWLAVRDRPDSTIPDEPAGGEQTQSPTQTGVAFRDAVRSRTFWALALLATSTFYTVLGVQAHVYRYMRDADFDAQVATNAVSLFFLCALGGKFLFGVLSDHLDRTRVFYGNLLIMLLGAITLAEMNIGRVWVAVTLFGLGWGGAYTLLQLTAINTFGTRDAGKILGTITILDATGGGLGVWLTGVLYDRTGSYDLPFALFVGLVVFAILCLTQVRPAPSPQA